MKLLAILLFTVSALAAQTTHSVTLTWVDASNPTGTTYSVYRASGLCSGTPTFSKIASAVAVKTFSDTTVTPGKLLLCRDRFFSRGGIGAVKYRQSCDSALCPYRTQLYGSVNERIFTIREHLIARLVVEGLSNKEIGRALNKSEGMVKNFLRPMYDKSGMGSRLELALWYLHHFLGDQQ